MTSNSPDLASDEGAPQDPMHSSKEIEGELHKPDEELLASEDIPEEIKIDVQAKTARLILEDMLIDNPNKGHNLRHQDYDVQRKDKTNEGKKWEILEAEHSLQYYTENPLRASFPNSGKMKELLTTAKSVDLSSQKGRSAVMEKVSVVLDSNWNATDDTHSNLNNLAYIAALGIVGHHVKKRGLQKTKDIAFGNEWNHHHATEYDSIDRLVFNHKSGPHEPQEVFKRYIAHNSEMLLGNNEANQDHPLLKRILGFMQATEEFDLTITRDRLTVQTIYEDIITAMETAQYKDVSPALLAIPEFMLSKVMYERRKKAIEHEKGRKATKEEILTKKVTELEKEIVTMQPSEIGKTIKYVAAGVTSITVAIGSIAYVANDKVRSQIDARILQAKESVRDFLDIKTPATVALPTGIYTQQQVDEKVNALKQEYEQRLKEERVRPISPTAAAIALQEYINKGGVITLPGTDVNAFAPSTVTLTPEQQKDLTDAMIAAGRELSTGAIPTQKRIKALETAITQTANIKYVDEKVLSITTGTAKQIADLKTRDDEIDRRLSVKDELARNAHVLANGAVGMAEQALALTRTAATKDYVNNATQTAVADIRNIDLSQIVENLANRPTADYVNNATRTAQANAEDAVAQKYGKQLEDSASKDFVHNATATAAASIKTELENNLVNRKVELTQEQADGIYQRLKADPETAEKIRKATTITVEEYLGRGLSERDLKSIEDKVYARIKSEGAVSPARTATADIKPDVREAQPATPTAQYKEPSKAPEAATATPELKTITVTLDDILRRRVTDPRVSEAGKYIPQFKDVDAQIAYEEFEAAVVMHATRLGDAAVQQEISKMYKAFERQAPQEAVNALLQVEAKLRKR